MAYDPENPPSLMAQGVGGTTGMRWFALMWVDPIADVLDPGYISNAVDIGLRAGDGLLYKDVNRGEWDQYHLICLEVDDETGAATIAFPEVPEEALNLLETFDPEDPSAYVVMMYGGRQVRVDASQFSIDTFQTASQAEAEAGVVNDKRMTPLRTKQAIDAQVSGVIVPDFASQAEAEAGVVTDKMMSPLRTAQAIAALGGALPTISPFAETLLDDADAATMLGTLGVSAFVQTIFNDADAATVRGTLGLGSSATLAETTTAQYLNNTADKGLSTDQVWSAAAPVTLTDAATIAVDMSTFINGVVVLGGNRTLGNPTNAKAGQSGAIFIAQDATGNRTLAFSSNYKFAFGVDPVLSTGASSYDLLYYYVYNSSFIVCSLSKSLG